MLCGLVNSVGLSVALCLIPSVTAPYIGAALIGDNGQRGPVSHAAFWGSLIVGPFAGLAGYVIYRHPNMPGPRHFWTDASLRERMWIGLDLMAVLAFLSTIVGIATAPGRFSSNAVVVVCLGGEAGWALIRIFIFRDVLVGALAWEKQLRGEVALLELAEELFSSVLSAPTPYLQLWRSPTIKVSH
ncbi:hypothetical protein TRAPUB_6222 [Trametes pubescens]|uniref:Uncharacterized protein n=1 Tax=Trametes pubescens TaxID=154538 RepID=A0A1M2V6M3_TRAPU|nr:hypothetical protein TRAPUB_6222 [Trametes pubescens]